MAKYMDKTQEEWDKLVVKWHEDTSITCSLQEFLELNDTEYLKMCMDISEPDITDEEVIKRSKELAKDVVTELVIKPKLVNVIKEICDNG